MQEKQAMTISSWLLNNVTIFGFHGSVDRQQMGQTNTLIHDARIQNNHGLLMLYLNIFQEHPHCKLEELISPLVYKPQIKSQLLATRKGEKK